MRTCAFEEKHVFAFNSLCDVESAFFIRTELCLQLTHFCCFYYFTVNMVFICNQTFWTHFTQLDFIDKETGNVWRWTLHLGKNHRRKNRTVQKHFAVEQFSKHCIQKLEISCLSFQNSSIVTSGKFTHVITCRDINLTKDSTMVLDVEDHYSSFDAGTCRNELAQV